MSKTRVRGRYLVATVAAFAAMLTLIATALPAAAQTATPTTTATANTQTIHLTTGWNLVGWLHPTMNVGDALAGGAEGTNDVTSDVDVVWGFDSASQTWSGYFPAATDIPGANDLEQLKSPNGYFIHATADVDWVVAG
jgi:hypothetical protein